MHAHCPFRWVVVASTDNPDGDNVHLQSDSITTDREYQDYPDPPTRFYTSPGYFHILLPVPHYGFDPNKFSKNDSPNR